MTTTTVSPISPSAFRASMASHAEEVWLTRTPDLADSWASEPPSPRLPPSPGPYGQRPPSPSSSSLSLVALRLVASSFSTPSSSSSSSSYSLAPPAFALSPSMIGASPAYVLPSSAKHCAPVAPLDELLDKAHSWTEALHYGLDFDYCGGVASKSQRIVEWDVASSADSDRDAAGMLNSPPPPASFPPSASMPPPSGAPPYRMDAFQPPPLPLQASSSSKAPHPYRPPSVTSFFEPVPTLPYGIHRRPPVPTSPVVEQLQRERCDSRSSSLPPPSRPRPLRRRTQEAADIPSIAALYPALFPSSFGLQNSSGSSSAQTGKSAPRAPARGWSNSTSGYAPLPTPSSSNTSVDDLVTPPRLSTPSFALNPATDHPLTEAEMRDVWERLERDFAGVDPEGLRGPFRQLALSMQTHKDPSTTFATVDARQLMTSSPMQLAKSFDPGTPKAPLTPKGMPLTLSQHHQGLVSPARSVVSNVAALEDDASVMARTTVSPKEAFVDYEDVSHRLEDAKALRRAAVQHQHQQYVDTQSPKSGSNMLFGAHPSMSLAMERAASSATGMTAGVASNGARAMSPVFGHVVAGARRPSSPVTASSPGRGSVGPEESKKVSKLLPHHVPKNAMRVGTSGTTATVGATGDTRRARLASPVSSDTGELGSSTNQVNDLEAAADQSSDDDMMGSSAEFQSNTVGPGLFSTTTHSITDIVGRPDVTVDEEEEDEMDEDDDEQGGPSKWNDPNSTAPDPWFWDGRRASASGAGVGGKSLPLAGPPAATSSSASTPKNVNVSSPRSQPRRSGRNLVDTSDRQTRAASRNTAFTSKAIQDHELDDDEGVEQDEIEEDEEENGQDSDEDPGYVPDLPVTLIGMSTISTRRRNAGTASSPSDEVLPVSPSKKRKHAPTLRSNGTGSSAEELPTAGHASATPTTASFSPLLQQAISSAMSTSSPTAANTSSLQNVVQSRKKRQRTDSPRSPAFTSGGQPTSPLTTTFPTSLVTPTGRPKSLAPATLAAGGVSLPGGQIRCDWIDVETGVACEVIFRRPYDLARHKETIHSLDGKKKNQWICRECGGEFSRKDALYRHCRIKNHKSGLV